MQGVGSIVERAVLDTIGLGIEQHPSTSFSVRVCPEGSWVGQSN